MARRTPSVVDMQRQLATPDDLRRHAERLQVLYDASKAFAASIGDVKALVDTVACTCSRLVGDYCSVALVREGTDWLDLAAVYHPDPDLERDFRTFAGAVPVKVGEGVMGRVIAEDAPLLLPVVDPETIVARAPAAYREIARRLHACSFVGVAMHVRGRVIGGVSMARSRPDAPYTQDDVPYLQDLADRAALAIENARLHADLGRRVQEATEELTKANEELRETNARLVEEVQERRRTTEALTDANRRVGEANRDLESFSYSVAHDLRAPLRAIDGFSQILVEDFAKVLGPEGRGHLDHVREGARRMARLIDDLLELSRVTRAEIRRERVDVSALALSVVRRLRQSEPDRDVDVVVTPGLVASADPRLLEVVLTNLLGNGWKFTSKRAAARIELATQPGPPAVFLVRDNGAGFDEEYVGKLFGVFQRLHHQSEFEGTGVGLATVQRIVRRHGGRVWAEGAVGHGATFYFTLEPG